MCCMYTVYSGMQEWVIQIPSIPILVSVLFPSLHLKYFRIKFLLLVKNKSCWIYEFVVSGVDCISLLGGIYGEYTTKDRSQSKFARYSPS